MNILNHHVFLHFFEQTRGNFWSTMKITSAVWTLSVPARYRPQAATQKPSPRNSAGCRNHRLWVSLSNYAWACHQKPTGPQSLCMPATRKANFRNGSARTTRSLDSRAQSYILIMATGKKRTSNFTRVPVCGADGRCTEPQMIYAQGVMKVRASFLCQLAFCLLVWCWRK